VCWDPVRSAVFVFKMAPTDIPLRVPLRAL
jgi:hypothetical protein